MATYTIGELEIFYTEKGTGEALVIFPDQLHTSRGYADEIDHFAERFHVVAFDYPETGRSTREAKYHDEWAFDLWTFRADLACHLLIDLGIESAYAMGTFGGALAALHFAGKQVPQHPLTIKGLIADSFLADMDGRTLHRALDVREHYYVRNAKLLQEEHGDDWREVVDADTQWLRRLADRGGYAVPDSILNAIACPVLLTGHQQDPRTPGIAQAYARISSLIPNCTVYLSSTSRHPYIEYPYMWSDRSGFRTLVDRFLAPQDAAS
jgi:pimeloyl-ACP methyl ester carboxylesterase